MERYYEQVVARLRAAGYRWYETANFCLPGRESRHNLGYWLGHDYAGIGVGAVGTRRPRAAAEPAVAARATWTRSRAAASLRRRSSS